MLPLSPLPFLLLAVVASVLQRSSASFSCYSDYLRNSDYRVCSANANRLDSAVRQSQGETTDFYCVSVSAHDLVLSCQPPPPPISNRTCMSPRRQPPTRV